MDAAVVMESGAPLTLALASPVTSYLCRGRWAFVWTVCDRQTLVQIDSACQQCSATHTHTHTHTEWKGCPQPSAHPPNTTINEKKKTPATTYQSNSNRSDFLCIFLRCLLPGMAGGGCSTDSSAALHTTLRSLPGSGQICVRSIIIQTSASKDKPHPRASPPARARTRLTQEHSSWRASDRSPSSHWGLRFWRNAPKISSVRRVAARKTHPRRQL